MYGLRECRGQYCRRQGDRSQSRTEYHAVSGIHLECDSNIAFLQLFRMRKFRTWGRSHSLRDGGGIFLQLKVFVAQYLNSLSTPSRLNALFLTLYKNNRAMQPAATKKSNPAFTQ